MGDTGVAFQAPHVFRPAPPTSRAPSGSPSKPSIPTSLPGFPGIPVFQVPKTIIQGIVRQGGLPVPTRPASRPQPGTIVDYTIPPSQVLTGPIAGPGIPPMTDQGNTPPPIMPTDSGPGGGGGGGSGAGGVAVAASARIPWLTIALIAGGLYLVTS
jgi:hypothetical protein